MPPSGSGSGVLQSPTDTQAQYSPATAPPSAGGLPQPNYEPPRRAPTLARSTHEELHISTSSAQPQQQGAMYNSPDHYRAPPDINVAPAGPPNNQYGVPTVPGSLQPAGGNTQQQRPSPSSPYTSGPVVPTQPQIASNAQQYTLPTRSNTNQSQHSPQTSHSYSRSSPAGMGPDQKYVPFSNTPDQQKYPAAAPAQKYYANTPSGAASHSPLGLADIRPRANSAMDQEAMNPGNAMIADQNKVPSNSNYLAPWSIYAYDWCKWSVPGGNSAGKMAVGSYLEDNHNFVRIPYWVSIYVTDRIVRFASWTPKSYLKKTPLQAHNLLAWSILLFPKPHALSLSHEYSGSPRHHKSSLLIFWQHLVTIYDYGPYLKHQETT